LPIKDPEYLQRLTEAILEAAGASKDEAAIVADHLVTSNLYGVDSHGVIRIVEYLQLIEKGEMKLGSPPEVVRNFKATANLDGRSGIGQLAAKKAMEIAIEKASEYGTGTVTIFNSGHIGRLGAYPVLAAQRDMVGIFYVKGKGGDASPMGGRKALLGTSPMSYAIPVQDSPPIFSDFATTVSAEGKIRVMKSKGLPLPEGWVLDSKGKPSRDPDDFYKRGGSLALFGGHKGYALNLFLEGVAGALSGAGVLDEIPSANAAIAQAINIEFFTDLAKFKKNMKHLVDEIRSSLPAEGSSEVLLPGDIEYREMTKRKEKGIDIDDAAWQDIIDVAEKLHVMVE
jgi:hydroxycarboxylate dehydrogenase B